MILTRFQGTSYFRSIRVIIFSSNFKLNTSVLGAILIAFLANLVDRSICIPQTFNLIYASAHITCHRTMGIHNLCIWCFESSKTSPLFCFPFFDHTVGLEEMWFAIAAVLFIFLSVVQGQVTVCLATYGGSPTRYAF